MDYLGLKHQWVRMQEQEFKVKEDRQDPFFIFILCKNTHVHL